MNKNPTRLFSLLTLSVLSSLAFASQDHVVRDPRPALYIAGDSTAAKSPKADQEGWGEPFAAYFDPAKISVINLARGGRSSRTYITEGHWALLIAQVKPGDFVLLQFGHNDAGALNEEPPGSTRPLRARGTIPGLGNEAQAIDNVITGKHEVVHTFGWYLRKMIADVREHKATPILLSLTVRNIWKDGRTECGSGGYRQWIGQTAKASDVELIDLTRIVADRYQALGGEAVKKLFSLDDIHTNAAGAEFNAAAVVAGLQAIDQQPFAAVVSEKGRAVSPDPGPDAESVCERIE